MKPILALAVQANHRAAPPQTRAEHAHRHTGAALYGTRPRTRNRLPSLGPFELLRAFAKAILQTDAGVRSLIAELPRHIPEAEFQRIQLEPVGDIVHQRFD